MPTYNSAQHLRPCLDSFRAQTFDDWELVCVDKGSTDGTLEILDEYQRSWPKLRLLKGGNERTSQINAAVSVSSSDYIYYTASDFYVDETLLSDAMAALSRDDADGVWINCISSGDHFWAKVRDFERSTYFGSEKFEGIRLFRRSLYLEVGGYDDNVPIFEEYDLQDRMIAAGARFTRVSPAAEYHLDEPRTLGDIWRRSFYIGTRYKDLLAKQGPKALRHANPIRSTFMKSPRRFIEKPDLALGFLALLVTKYLAGALGVVASSIIQGRSHRESYGVAEGDVAK